MQDPYLVFFLYGRSDVADNAEEDDEIDLGELAAKATQPAAFRTACAEAAKKGADDLPAIRALKLRSWRDEIKTAGGDDAKAWAAYVEGWIDATRIFLELDLAEFMLEEDEEDKEEDDEDEEDEDEEAEDDAE